LGKRQDNLELKFENLHKEHKRLEEHYTLLNNKINLILIYSDKSKAKQNLYIQNCEYIKEEVTQFFQRLDSLKKKLNTEKCEKEIVLSLSGLVTTTRAINSERRIYLRALPEKAKDSS
jgi:phosphopantetheine adenylyltransferase